jgi:hypothetical protein
MGVVIKLFQPAVSLAIFAAAHNAGTWLGQAGRVSMFMEWINSRRAGAIFRRDKIFI